MSGRGSGEFVSMIVPPARLSGQDTNSDHVLAAASIQQMIQDDAAERRGADAVEREAAERELEVTGAEHERDRDRDEIARVGEVDAVLDPDASGSGGDQAEHHD